MGPSPLLVAALLLLAPPSQAATPPACGTEPDASRSLLALHRFWSERGGVSAQSTSAAPERVVSHVTVLEDRGDLVARPNRFDLDGASLRLTPNRAGGYDAARVALAVETGDHALSLSGDAAQAVALPFPFPFFGIGQTRAFVHADGSLTFGASDASPNDRGLGRLLSGPPRIAALFTDLDPGHAGSVSTRLLSDRAVIAWTDVPGAGQLDRNTFSVTLHADGTIDLVYGRIESREAVVGVSPGRTDELAAADLSQGEPRGASGALAERFTERERLDLPATVRRFLRSAPDLFDQVVVYTTRPLNPQAGSLAFQVNVANAVQGIGLGIRDDARDWGSAGALASVVYMDSVDPYLDVDGFEILGHETGHRWLANLRVRDAAGAESTALLGRGDVHWSFFLDTDASVLEGNDIAERGGGRFENVDIVRGFSALDQYAMGLRDAGEVPPFFLVEAADDFQPGRTYTRTSGPEVGVAYTGVRHDVTIDDVIAALGPRVPDASHAPHLLRQAYVLVSDPAAPASDERVGAVARIRSRFEAWYAQATGGRGRVQTTLP